MDETRPVEGGKATFPLEPGTYDAHLANKKKSKSGGLTFTINPDRRH